MSALPYSAEDVTTNSAVKQQVSYVCFFFVSGCVHAQDGTFHPVPHGGCDIQDTHWWNNKRKRMTQEIQSSHLSSLNDKCNV